MLVYSVERSVENKDKAFRDQFKCTPLHFSTVDFLPNIQSKVSSVLKGLLPSSRNNCCLCSKDFSDLSCHNGIEALLGQHNQFGPVVPSYLPNGLWESLSTIVYVQKHHFKYAHIDPSPMTVNAGKNHLCILWRKKKKGIHSSS